MSRNQRVKDALTSTLNKLREEIEASHANGKIPADYSLGFTNGLIFCDHHFQMRDGKPKFYDRTTSIGSLPKPMTLKDGKYKDLMGADAIFEEHRDRVILAARNVFDKGYGLEPLQIAIDEMDSLVDQLSGFQETEKNGDT